MVEVTVRGFVIKVPDDVARKMIEFEKKCLEARGVPQIRSRYMGYPGFGRDEILLVCIQGSGIVASEYIKVPDETVKTLMNAIASRAVRIYDIFQALKKALGIA